jgi:2-dehydro-3-deoxygluconokinase
LIFSFGEILLRLSPALNGEWIEKKSMRVYIGGSELNMAAALANWNIPVKYFTAMPDNYLSRDIMNDIQSKKIDTSAIYFSGNRIGIYYLPQGTDLKNEGVIYDRSLSSFSELNSGMINWDEVLNNCDWIHFSAISPGLSKTAAALCKEALEAASAKGLTISVDLNYRAKLWQYGKLPVEVMPELLQYCDVVMGNIWAVESLLGLPSAIANSKGKSKDELVVAARESMKSLHLVYPKIATTAYTFRLDENYFGILQRGDNMVVSKEHHLEKVIDKAGSGDCFMAGIIYGLQNKNPIQQVIDFAAEAAVGKLYEPGDTTLQSTQQINARIL